MVEAFVSRLGTLLGKLAVDEAGMLIGVPDEIQKLDRMLGDISQVLADAEMKRIEVNQINKWLVDLKDAMYDADDILDEVLIAGVQLRHRSWSSPSLTASSVCCQFSDLLTFFLWRHFPNLLSFFRNPVFTREIGKQIRSLNLRLDNISARKSRLDLLKLPPRREDTVRASGSRISKHTSPLVEPDIVGTKIDENTRDVVEWLTKEDDRENLLVYGITGMGGIGKTTLAQNIYNDQSIVGNFSTRMWVCVSQDFAEDKLLWDIIRSAGYGDGRDEGRTILEPILESSVRGKKFLLVLDDVWDPKVWVGLLEKPLRIGGGFGSRILVTTRNEEVAKQMKAVDILRVGLLNPEDGWSLLCKKVVLGGKEREIEDLKEGVGMEIVEKCGGLPLAIMVVGGVLCKKKRVRSAWKEVLRSTTWSVTGLPQGIHEALYLSYEELPPHLKQCFLFCSLFPEDSTICKEDLVRIWIAEGFVKGDEGMSSLMEDLGEDYYWELVSRNLLQLTDVYGGAQYCRIHDLLRSLAQFLSRDECMIVKEAQGFSTNCTSLRTKPRHLTIIEGDAIVNIPDGFRSLRTLLFVPRSIQPGFDLGHAFQKFRRLRVVDLSSTSISELPDSIDSLVHLRYINLGHTPIIALPESIGNLKNLQFLILEYCESLCGLPKGVKNLQELRCLDVRWTNFDGIPVGVGTMQQLNTLRGFRLHPNSSSEDGWCRLEELRPLTRLRELVIDNLECASTCSPSDGGGVLVNKPNLTSISLESGAGWATVEEVVAKRFEEVFEELCPPSCVETLTMVGYRGRRFPSWMMAVQAAPSSSLVLSNLTILTLVGCRYCEQLPPLGQLPHLVSIYIGYAEGVVGIGPEFLGNSSIGVGGCTATSHPSPSFPKLKILVMEWMNNCEEWQWEEGEAAMPLLEGLSLSNCPMLRSLPRGLLRHATALTRLEISEAYSLTAVENLHSLRHLILCNCIHVERISNLPALIELAVFYCPWLRVVYNLGTELRFVTLDGKRMESIPGWLWGGGIEIADSAE